MSGFIDIASSILSQSERRTELSAQNIANISTVGFKRRIGFSQLIDPFDPAPDRTHGQSFVTDFSPGKPIQSGDPLDFAISGPGFFVLQGLDGPVYTRQGQFKLDADGRLVSLQGLPVQADGGGDIRIKSQPFTVADDGSVLENGQPIAKLALVKFSDVSNISRTETGDFTAPASVVQAVESPSVRQGMLESSNVSTGDEMISVMEALRRAEAAQRLINVYDDLIGRALSSLGQA